MMTLSFLDYFSRPSESQPLNGLSAGQAGVVDITLAVRRTGRKPHRPDVKFILQIVLALAFVFSLFALDSIPRGGTASLTLYLGDQRRVFVGEVVPNMTVLDTINAATLAGNIPFNFAIEGDKTRIMNFGGLRTAAILDKYSIFLNDQLINPTDINRVPVKASDAVVMRIELSGRK